jgi:HNH endonuclease/AP2 domain
MLTQRTLNSILIYKGGLLFWKDTGFFCEPKLSNGYLSLIYKRRYYSFHRVIWTMHNGVIPDGMVVDHINNNRSDNRIENLRLATRTQNSQNTLKTSSKTSSKYKGVYKKGDRWVAQITHEGKSFVIGTYRSEENAAEAYKEMAEALFGEFARV